MEATIAARFIQDKPQRLIEDRAYDSDPLDSKLREEGIEPIAPHRRNRVKPKTQDGRKLRRYKRRMNCNLFYIAITPTTLPSHKMGR